MNRTLISTLLLFGLMGCEYERLAISAECNPDSNSIIIENISITDSECEATIGSITIDATSRTSQLTYSLNGSDFSPLATFSNLAAGAYRLSIREMESGCSLDTGIVIQNSNGVNLLSIESTNAGCGTSNGVITLTTSNATGQVTYSIPGVGTQIDDPVFSDLSVGTYTVNVSDAEGCEITTDPIEILSGISLSSDILPIIRANCQNNSSCHVTGGVSPNFDSEATIANRSERIRIRTSNGTMPPANPLAQDQIDQIICWANEGGRAN